MSFKTILMPILDANETEATVTTIYKKSGDYVAKGDLILSIENSKATGDIVSEHTGYVRLLVSEFEKKSVGETVAQVFDSLEEFENCSADDLSSEADSTNATKKAIELAKKLGVDLADVSRGLGVSLVREKDVMAFLQDKTGTDRGTMEKEFSLDRERVVIIGAGKGAEVVIDILLDDPNKVIIGLVDDNVRKMQNYDYPVFDCSIDDFPDRIDRRLFDTAIISIGSNRKSMQLRADIFRKYTEKGIKFTNAIDRSAIIRRGVKLGKGNIIGSGCYVGTLTHIGDNNSISYGANIGHHNIIGNNNLIGPGVFTSGSDIVGNDCVLPAGVHLINRICIGNDVILPLGYSAVCDIKDSTTIKNNVSNTKTNIS